METLSTLGDKPIDNAFQRGFRRSSHYLSPEQSRRIAKLRTILRERQGHVLLSGPAGTGKTTLLKRIIEDCSSEGASVIHFLTPPSSLDLVKASLLRQISPSTEGSETPSASAQTMRESLCDFRASHRVVIFVDETQSVPDEVLVGLFRIAHQDGDEKGVRVPLVLAGTDGTGDRLSRILEQPLPQLVRMTVELKPLDIDEVMAYVRLQLANSESKDTRLFSDEAIMEIAKLSGGLQSEVSTLCGLSMLAAQLEGAEQVTPDIVKQVSRDSWISPPERNTESRIPNGRAPNLGSSSDCSKSASGNHGGLYYPTSGPFFGQNARASNDGGRSPCPETHEARASQTYSVSDSRLPSARPWGWGALAVTLLAGSTPYLFNYTEPARHPKKPPQPATIVAQSISQEPSQHPGNGITVGQAMPNKVSASIRRMQHDPEEQVELPNATTSKTEVIDFDGRAVLASTRATIPGDLAPILPAPAAGSTPSPTLSAGAGTLWQRMPQKSGIPLEKEQLLFKPGPDGVSLTQGAILFNTTDTSPTPSPGRHPVSLTGDVASRKKISTLLQLAEEHLAADRLMSPKFENAMYLYREVLRIDPENGDAKQGVRRVKNKLISHSQSARARGDLIGTRYALDKVLAIDAQDEHALLLLDQAAGVHAKKSKNEIKPLSRRIK